MIKLTKQFDRLDYIGCIRGMFPNISFEHLFYEVSDAQFQWLYQNAYNKMINEKHKYFKKEFGR